MRLRSEAALTAVSRAEAALDRERAKLAKAVEARQGAIAKAEAAVGSAYRDLADAFGSRERAAECLGLSTSQLRAAIALAPPSEDEQA